MPNTRSKSRNFGGAKSKYMRSSVTEDDPEEVMESSINGLTNCFGQTQQEIAGPGMYKCTLCIIVSLFSHDLYDQTTLTPGEREKFVLFHGHKAKSLELKIWLDVLSSEQLPHVLDHFTLRCSLSVPGTTKGL